MYVGAVPHTRDTDCLLDMGFENPRADSGNTAMALATVARLAGPHSLGMN